MKKTLFVITSLIITVNLFSQTAEIKTHDYSEGSASKRYNILIKYPQVDFGPDALMGVRGIASDINRAVDTLIENKKSVFTGMITNLNPEPCAQQISFLGIDYKTVYNNSSLFSFLFEVNYAPDCSNHPLMINAALNYSTGSAGAFKISDIFLPDTKYLEFISDYCIKELTSRAVKDFDGKTDVLIMESLTPSEENFSVFTVTDKSITVIFNPYRVGPYSWGIQSVVIPVADMKTMIDPKGPLGSFTR